MATWPVTLPQVSIRSAWSEQQRDNALRSTMGYGPAKVRLRSTVEIYDGTRGFVMNDAQLATFNTFFDDNQTIPWDWDEGEGLRSYRFIGVPTIRELTCDKWSVSFKLEVMP